MKSYNILAAAFAAVAVAILLLACGGGDENGESNEPAAAEVEAVRAKGAAAADALMKSLGGQLKGALESGGPVNAIQVCQQAALPLTAAAGEQFEGVSIRRTTLKPRSPANTPDDTDRSVLEKMAAAAAEVEPGQVPEPHIEWQADKASYYRPLMIQEVCLKCHGDPQTFSPELTKALSERYPADQATGYQLGDFRGAIRVDIDRE